MNNLKNKKGQSTLEFILTFSMTFGFILLFLKMALNYTNGFLVHHATFMASRAFLSSDAEVQKPEARDQAALELAKKVFAKNLPESLLPVPSAQLNANLPDSTKFTPFIGVWIEYAQPFSMGFIGGKDQVKFRSESFLGREPSRAEVILQVCAAIKLIAFNSCEGEATLDDNGA